MAVIERDRDYSSIDALAASLRPKDWLQTGHGDGATRAGAIHQSDVYIYLLIFVPLLELYGSIILLSGNFLCHVVCRDNVKSAQELLTNQV